MNINGYFHEAFAPVKEQFVSHFLAEKEAGAALAVWYHGELVVNAWAGTRDKAQTLPWTDKTLVNIFSTSKMISAVAVQRAVDSGDLDLHRPLQDLWPEFGSEGKSSINLAWCLNHRAGLPAIREPVADEALFDWDYMCSRLARERPWWEPGTQHGYHMVTFGWLVGEAFRRMVGISLGEYLESEIVRPLGLDLHLGVEEESVELADLLGVKDVPTGDRIHLFQKVLQDRDSMTAKALTNPASLMTSSNRSEWRRMELPSANVHSNAASLALLLGECIASERVISKAAMQRLMTEESVGYDPVLTTRTRFGPGVMLQLKDDIEAGFGKVPSGFGHPGSGGSLAFADPGTGLAFAYVMNQMGPYLLVDPRPRALANGVYDCLASV